MARSVSSLISRRRTVGVSNWVYRVGRCLGSRMSTVSVSDESFRCPATLPSRISPWLMLPPAVEGGDMVYKFYSLAEDKVLSLGKRPSASAYDDGTWLVGSSHGWLAMFDEENCDLFLTNPLSRRNVKLPSIHTLPMPQSRVPHGSCSVDNVIISCSPEAGGEDCRAMMTYGPQKSLAFCCPGRSTATEWTPIGAPSSASKNRDYESFVYSSRQKMFFCVTRREEFEAWDLRDPLSPRLIPLDFSFEDYMTEEEPEPRPLSLTMKSLVVDENSGDLFLVSRFIVERMDSDGSYAEEEEIDYDSDRGHENKYPYKTIGFDVHRYDFENRVFRYMDGGSLGGLSFFIGKNHGFAISAGELPELKPNSIYYTDVFGVIPACIECSYGGHDNGIFSYEDGTISPCYYPCDYQSIQRIVPEPMWFTPSPL